MAKRYIRVGNGNGWVDYPSTNTPRNATNLNIMDKGIDDIDNAVESIQAQVDQLVVSGDSSPAAAQAQVNASGYTFSSLKARLDDGDLRLADSLFLQTDEPVNTNSKTLWFDIDGTANFDQGGVSIENAVTSSTPPETVYWFEPIV